MALILGSQDTTLLHQWSNKPPNKTDRGENKYAKALARSGGAQADRNARGRKREDREEEVSFKRFLDQKENKQKIKRNKAHKLCTDAFSSGDTELYLKCNVIATLRSKGKAEKLFWKMDKDNIGTVEASELEEYLGSMGYNLTRNDRNTSELTDC